MRTLILLILTSMLLGCQHKYRYPCQDPKNWDKTECNNLVCEVEKSCTDHVLNKSVQDKMTKKKL